MQHAVKIKFNVLLNTIIILFLEKKNQVNYIGSQSVIDRKSWKIYPIHTGKVKNNLSVINVTEGSALWVGN